MSYFFLECFLFACKFHGRRFCLNILQLVSGIHAQGNLGSVNTDKEGRRTVAEHLLWHGLPFTDFVAALILFAPPAFLDGHVAANPSAVELFAGLDFGSISTHRPFFILGPANLLKTQRGILSTGVQAAN